MSSNEQENEMQATRRTNLRALVAQRGLSNLSRTLGLKNPSYLGHLTSGRRKITADACAKVEQGAGLAEGWLSTEHKASKTVAAATPVQLDSHALAETLAAVRHVLGNGNVSVSRQKEADIVTLVYLRRLEQGKIDPSYIEQLVQLAGR